MIVINWPSALLGAAAAIVILFVLEVAILARELRSETYCEGFAASIFEAAELVIARYRW